MPKLKNITCKICKSSFTRAFSLKVHVKKIHFDQFSILYPEKQYKCVDCNKEFLNKENLKKHIALKHYDKRAQRQRQLLQCNQCEYHDNDKNNLIEHFSKTHGIDIIIDDLKFDSIQEFLNWKYEVEKETNSSFIKMHGSRKNLNYTRTIYSCHRSGQVRLTGTGQRHLKMQGSKKINGFCPASMEVNCRKNGKCYIQFLKTHVGHKDELGHLFLTDLERAELASKIANKIPFQTILDDIKDSVTSTNKLERLHLLKKKDLHNIEYSFNLNKNSVRHLSIESHKGKISKKLTDLRQKHRASEDLNLNIVQTTDNGWQVPSLTKKEVYFVQTVKENCECQLSCTECNACLHQFKCTCIDSSIKWNMCKHIHLVCKFMKKNQSEVVGLEGTNNLHSTVEVQVAKEDESDRSVDSMCESRDENLDSLQLKKEALITKACNAINSVESIQEYNAIKKFFDAFDATIIAVRANLSKTTENSQ